MQFLYLKADLVAVFNKEIESKRSLAKNVEPFCLSEDFNSVDFFKDSKVVVYESGKFSAFFVSPNPLDRYSKGKLERCSINVGSLNNLL